MKDKKALSIKEVLFVKEYKLQESARMAPIAENQSRLAEIISSEDNTSYASARSVQSMLSQILKQVGGGRGFRPIPKNLKESIVKHARSLLSEEGFVCFEEDFSFAIEATRKERSLIRAATDGHGYVLFDKEFVSATKNLLKHIELLGDNSSSFESMESKLSFRYKGVDIDICLKRSVPEKSD